MARTRTWDRSTLGPLDPIFRRSKVSGFRATGSTPAFTPAVAEPSIVELTFEIPTPTVTTSTFDPVTSIPWTVFNWAGGPAALALGYTDGEVLASGDTLPDETGNGHPMTYVSGNPTYDTADALCNNKPSIFFTSDRMDHTPWTALTDYTIVVIGYLFDGSVRPIDTQTNGQRIIPMMTFGGNWQLFAGGSALQSAAMPGDALYATRSRLGSAVTGSHSGHANGTAIYTGGNVGTVNSVGHRVGNASGNIRLCVYAVYPGDLTADAEWANFQAWVLAEFGVNI